jgi:hypothetical protein
MPDVLRRDNFFRAHNRARREDLLARLSGRPKTLLPFEVILDTLKVYEQIPRPSPEMVPLDRIIGSVGRYKDFTRDFLPRTTSMADRWARVETAMEGMAGLPPIDVYKVGDVYFVADGNHRVSVARANGFEDIEAHVTEIPVCVDLEPGDSLDEAIIKAERSRFLAETQLGERLERLDIYFTRPRGFVTLLEHVKIHQRLVTQERGEALSMGDAAEDWYRNSYLPIIQMIRDRNLLQRFPGRTAADLYVWLWGYIFESHHRFGERIEPDEAASMMELRAGSRFRQAVLALMGRLSDISRSMRGDADQMPDWVTQTFEWNDGSLSQLAGGEEG